MWDPRLLRKYLYRHIDLETVREEQELCPGGDIRVKGNRWVRDAFQESGIQRVPRQAEVHKVVKHLVHRCNLCSLAFRFVCHFNLR